MRQPRSGRQSILLTAFLVPLLASSADAQSGTGRIADYTSIGGDEWFGAAVAPIGDLDGDGTIDIAVGQTRYTSATDPGHVHIVFLNPDGTAKSVQPIGNGLGGFTGVLDPGDTFGYAVAALGDLDGDGVTELAVGAINADEDEIEDVGALWILLLNDDGTVKEHREITSENWGLASPLTEYGNFGTAIDPVGDLDGDGIIDIAVGAAWDSAPGWRQGSVTILFLTDQATVKTSQKISSVDGGFTGLINDYDLFGLGVAGIGDVDGDGVGDLAVAAEHDQDGRPFTGAVWLLLLHGDGTVKAHAKISATQGGFRGDLSDEAHFASDVAAVGDVDGDGIGDLLVGHYTYRSGGGAWLLFLNADLTVKDHRIISNGQNGFTADSSELGRFGRATAALGDLDGDGGLDFAVGSPGTDRVFVLFADSADPQCTVAPLTTCDSDAKSRIRLKTNRRREGKDRLQWKWSGLTPGSADVGAPLVSTRYALCVWDRRAGQPRVKTSLAVEPGAGWSGNASDYRYEDDDGTADGIVDLRLRRRSNGRQAIQLKAKGASLKSPVPHAQDAFFALDPGLTVQLVSSDGGCWSADFDQARTSSATKFVAK